MREALRERLGSRAARRWYPGGVFGGLYSLIGVWFAWTGSEPLGVRLVSTLLLLAIPAVFVVLPPLLWGAPRRPSFLALLGYAGLICLLFPLIGESTAWLFIYVACAAASCFARFADAAAWIGAVVLTQFLVLLVTDQLAQDWFVITLTVSVSTMLRGISQLSRANAELKQAQGEIARLAVAEERARFSRDLHDVLGHSLTVVTVKAELGARLVDLDAERAKTELADIERLSRSALADLRAAVAGYRQMSLDTELAAARAALAAAEVDATVPSSAAAVTDPVLRELFAWTVREAVTNVIRHARAEHCLIELEADAVRIRDDGIGTAALVRAGGGAVEVGPGGGSDAAGGMRLGSGLAGLVERAASVGAALTLESSEPRGTIVTVRAAAR